MSQPSSSPCTQCGTPMLGGQQFCPNCGLTVGQGSNAPTQTPIPPPPPYTAYSQQGYQPPQQGTQPPPLYATPQQDSSKRVVRQIGCGVGVVILLIVLVLGAAGYFVVKSLGSVVRNGPSTSSNPGATPTQAPLTTTPINTTVTYAGTMITIVNAQQATSFADDAAITSPGAVRLNIKEHTVSKQVSYVYHEVSRLLLPDGKSITLTGFQNDVSPDVGVTRTNWLDFSVPTTIQVSQLILRLGKDTEAQMDIPLTGHADVSKYAPKMVSPNTQVHYGDLLVTLTTATAQLNADGQQADQGKRFIVVALTISNPSTSNVNAFPPDYIRLQAGGNTITPEGNTTIPLQFAAKTTNSQGTATFMVPQNETAFTLVLLTSSLTGAAKDTTIAFQIQ